MEGQETNKKRDNEDDPGRGRNWERKIRSSRMDRGRWRRNGQYGRPTLRVVEKFLRMRKLKRGVMSWLGKTAKSLFIFLFLFFSFLFFSYWTYNYKMEHGKVSCDFVTMSQWCDEWSQYVTVTVCHMTRVSWGPWESKHITTVVKCISSRELSENSIEFSLSNSEQRDSWLNSDHRTLDADNGAHNLLKHKV